MRIIRKTAGFKFGVLFMSAVLILTVMFNPALYTRASAYQNSDFSDDYGDFLYALGEAESGNDYSALSSNGQYFGRWQMGVIGLQDIGFLDSSENWTELAVSFGITSFETFLSSEDGQDYAILASHKKILLYAENMGITSYINTNVNGVTMTFAGMIAAAHALGVGGLQSLIKNGTSGYSGNDAIALRYMEKYGVYNIENTIRNGKPTIGTTESTITTTTTTTTTMTTTTIEMTTTTTTSLQPPSYISVRPDSDVAIVGEMLNISLSSDNADSYHILLTAPNGNNSEYMLSGSLIGLVIPMEGLYTINVTGYNKAGESYAEPIYIAAKKKVVVSEENIGDANMDGVVDIMDATKILKYYSYSAAGTTVNVNGVFNKDYADVNGDGKIDLTDATLVLSYYSIRASGTVVKWQDILSA